MRNSSHRAVAALACLLTASLALGATRTPGPPAGQKRTTLKVRKLKLKYRVGGDPTWHPAVGGRVPSETVALMFTAHLEGAASVRAVNVLAEVYKISAPAAADSDAFFRQQLFAVNRAGGQTVAVDHGHDERVSVVVDTHANIICPGCAAQQRGGAGLERVGLRRFDHLGEGPHFAELTVTQSDTTSAASAASAAAAPDNVNKASMFFQTGDGALSVPGVGSWRSRPGIGMMPAKFPFQRTRTE